MVNDGAIGDSCFAPGDLGYELYLSHITHDEKDFEPHSFLDPPSPSRVTVATSKKKPKPAGLALALVMQLKNDCDGCLISRKLSALV